jgi:hypothetical protein
VGEKNEKREGRERRRNTVKEEPTLVLPERKRRDARREMREDQYESRFAGREENGLDEGGNDARAKK